MTVQRRYGIPERPADSGVRGLFLFFDTPDHLDHIGEAFCITIPEFLKLRRIKVIGRVDEKK